MFSSKLVHALISLVVMGCLALAPSGCSSEDGSVGATTTGLAASGDGEYPPVMPSGLEVVKATGHGFKLEWQPNTETDLAGYRLFVYDPSPYRANSYTCPHGVALIDGTTTHFLYTEDLSEGLHYFKLAAVDQDGNESARLGPIEFDYTGPTDKEGREVTGQDDDYPVYDPPAGGNDDWQPGREEGTIDDTRP